MTPLRGLLMASPARALSFIYTHCLLVVCLFMVGCSYQNLAFINKARVFHILPPVIIVKPVIKEVLDVDVFDRVSVEGQLNVTLHSGYRVPRVILSGTEDELSHVKVTAKNGHLFISNRNKAQECPIHVDIQANSLTAFAYHGDGTINAPNLHADLSTLIISNPGTTHLKGDIMLHTVELRGHGQVTIEGVKAYALDVSLEKSPILELRGMTHLSSLALKGKGSFGLYWINSKRLKIRAKEYIHLRLAGKVDLLDLEITDYVNVNARYLRAKSAFVKTFGHSVASITTLDKQHALASEGSDIYFYAIPRLKAQFMAYDGSILDMRDWHEWGLKDYDRYNK